jgi:hypothetical protein
VLPSAVEHLIQTNKTQVASLKRVLRRESGDNLVPIDREPVPPEYVEQVRRYYERLGSGR